MVLLYFFLSIVLLYTTYYTYTKSVFWNFLLTFMQNGFLFLGASYLLLTYNNILTFNIIHWSSVIELLDIFDIHVDGISLTLIWLTTFLIFCCVLYNYNVIGFSYGKYNMLLTFINLLLILCFSVKNLLQFYIYFEGILIPMLILVTLGSRGRKVHASFLFFFYTFASSILLLFGLFFIYYKTENLNFESFYFIENFSLLDRIIVFLLFFFGFAAKVPLIPLHIWLPEAHVEAPTVGSVILAGLLLKLGAYGMFRVIFPICNFTTLHVVKPFLIPFLLVSLIYSAFSGFRQVDLKKIVAYSSVVHMSFSLLGLFSGNFLGVKGFLFLLISHGLISSGMFFMVGMLYDRFHVRNIFYYGGLVQYMPLFSIFYFFMIFSNMSLPGTCNFIGEFMVLYVIFPFAGIFSLLFSLLGLFATVVFCLILLYKVIFYQISGFLITNLIDVTYYEFFILFFISGYILIFGLMPNLLLNLFI